MIELYGIPSSRAQRSLWALEETGVPYQNVPTHFLGDTKTPEYLALNPNGRVPTLVDGDLVLFESMAINLYLARRHGKDLMPDDPADEARVVQWSFWGITETEPQLLTALMNRLMFPEPQRDEAKAQAALDELARPLAVLESHLAERDHLVTDHFTVADLNVASVLAMGRLCGLDLDPYPAVARWLKACTSRPAFARAAGR